MKIVEVTPENIAAEGIFCAKDFKSQGFENKRLWYEKQYEQGMRLCILKNEEGKAIGFVEYVPADQAWRPLESPGLLFIQCIMVYAKKDREQGLGALLIDHCEQEAKALGLHGLCTLTSSGAWVANKKLFKKQGFTKADTRGRFELMYKTWRAVDKPRLIDWEAKQANYQGWHLIYADQCPWHIKSVEALQKVAKEHGFEINIQRITTVEEAKAAPSGFGVFSLLLDGRLLEDHYISETRFRNILKKELKLV